MNKHNLTGIILAGGKSSRMGRDKGLIDYQGKPLIQYSIDVLKNICKKIFISSSNEKYHFLGYNVIPDEIEGIGPIGGIYSCLKKSKTSLNVVLSCDTPFITEELIFYILSFINGYDVIVPSGSGGVPEPLCGIYHKDIISRVEENINKGSYMMKELLEQVNCKIISIPEKTLKRTPDIFKNINYPRDF